MPRSTLNLRIDSSLKKEAEEVASDLGISMSAAIVLFLKALVRENGIPFNVRVSPSVKSKRQTFNASFLKTKKNKKSLSLPGSTSIKNAINKL